MNITKEMAGASIGTLILGLLAQKSSYGYQIIKRINTETTGIFVWREGTMYPVLHKLEKEGLVESRWETAENGRERKYYHITEKGRGALGECSRQWQKVYQVITRLTEALHA